MEIMHRLQQGDSIGTSIGIGDQDAHYRLAKNGLMRFRDMIYVSDDSEHKKLFLREFHDKPYLDYLGYHKTMKVVKKFYY